MQKVVSTSTTEAEYMATTEVVKEGLWLKGFMKELSGEDKQITIHCDSRSILCLMKNPMTIRGLSILT